MIKQISHEGVVYDVTAQGVISPQYRKRHSEWSNAFVEPPSEEVEICVKWLKLFSTPRKQVNYKIGSYGLKHVVEHLEKTYISNGAFIAAALHLGFDVIPHGPFSPNANFRLNYAKKSLAL